MYFIKFRLIALDEVDKYSILRKSCSNQFLLS